MTVILSTPRKFIADKFDNRGNPLFSIDTFPNNSIGGISGLPVGCRNICRRNSKTAINDSTLPLKIMDHIALVRRINVVGRALTCAHARHIDSREKYRFPLKGGFGERHIEDMGINIWEFGWIKAVYHLH